METKIINYLIKNLLFKEITTFRLRELKDELKCESNEIESACTAAALQHNLIKKHGNYVTSGLSLTKFGKDIKDKGGWNKYLKLKKEKEDKIEKKLSYDLKISKIKSKTFIPILILGAFGGIYSGYKLIKDLRILKSDQQIQEAKQQKEKEQLKSHTLTLTKKSLDSLSNSNQKKFVSDNKKQLDSI